MEIIGLTHHKMGAYDSASDCFSKSIELDYKDPLSYFNKGNTYFALK